MTVVGIGVDIVEVGRIERAIARWGDAFVRRIYTRAEIVRTETGVMPVPRLAARFAAKEAVMKALGIGWRAIAWRDIEITNDAAGRPIVYLHGATRRIAAERGVHQVMIALSHTREHAVANAIALGT
jgi:holo-[acyl-carrier protein] synthase